MPHATGIFTGERPLVLFVMLHGFEHEVKYLAELAEKVYYFPHLWESWRNCGKCRDDAPPVRNGSWEKNVPMESSAATEALLRSTGYFACGMGFHLAHCFPDWHWRMVILL